MAAVKQRGVQIQQFVDLQTHLQFIVDIYMLFVAVVRRMAVKILEMHGSKSFLSIQAEMVTNVANVRQCYKEHSYREEIIGDFGESHEEGDSGGGGSNGVQYLSFARSA